MGFITACLFIFAAYAIGYENGGRRAQRNTVQVLYWQTKFYEMKGILDRLITDIRGDMQAIGFGIAERAQTDLEKLERIKMP